MIKIERVDKFNNQEKKLKKHNEEMKTYEKILIFIKQSKTIEDLKNNPYSKIYGFEPLKHELNGYNSFNLCKNGGTIRLIVRLKEEYNIIELIFISMDHYEDFKKVRKMYE